MGPSCPGAKTSAPYYQQTLSAVVKHFGASTGTAWNELPFDVQHAVLYGTDKTKIDFVYDDGLRQYKTSKVFEGVIGNLERRYKETESAGMREEIEKYMSAKPCVACNGYRLKPESLAVKIDGRHIGRSREMSIKAASQWFIDLSAKLTPTQSQIGERILKEIRERLAFLNDVGLEYLTMARNSGTLSGGESQRIRLASQIGSGLTGVLYVLDEPSIGLHQRDNARLLETLQRLRDLGNTVIVVEHDEDAILTADYVLDIGPGAGIHGGNIVAEGTPQDISTTPIP
jgi:excinuclease ABC subunit A